MPPQHNPKGSDLLSELESHNEFFDNLVNMIPARLYIAGASGDDSYHPKYLKGQHKESKEARRARNKVAKMEKFDPNKAETTLEVKKRVQAEMDEADHSSDDEDMATTENDDDDEEEEGSGEKVDNPENKNSKPSESKPKSNTDSTISYASRIEMLRAKLHAKMAEKRAAAGISADDNDASNNTQPDTSAPALVSKRAARRAEKRKRQEAAKQKNKKKAMTAAGDHMKNEPQRVVNLGGSKFNDLKSTAKEKGPNGASAAEDLATIDFQGLAGLKPKLDPALDNKSLNPKLSKKKSLEKLLEDAERKQARLRELKESQNEEDKEKARNIEWGDALKTAAGTNSRKTTDPKLLKKAMKKKAKKKSASVKAWGARLEQAKEAADKKQQIRNHNLNQRKVGGAVGANLSSKRVVEPDEEKEGGKGKKEGEDKGKRRRLGPHSQHGRNRAGFEGKKQGFINGESSKASGSSKGKQ